jgi:flagella basal body P-ring formation protein FlgA
VVLLLLVASPVCAESLVATRVIRAQTLLSSDDLSLVAADIVGALTHPDEAVGLEAKVTLYPGRAIRQVDVGAPALIDRNQVVPLVYRAGGLGIVTEGRALARAGLGEKVRVMNLSSRATLWGVVADDGSVIIGAAP